MAPSCQTRKAPPPRPEDCGSTNPRTACVAIAFFPSDGSDVDDLLAHADLALYEAKRRGRGGVEYYRRDLRHAMERRVTLEHALRSCDPDEEMAVFLQPICTLDAVPAVWGAEALLRWNHPTLGPLSPAEFIAIAEQSGDVLSIGRWVLRQVADLATRFNRHREQPIQFAANVSSRQLTLDDLHGAVVDAVTVTGCDPSWLTIELTESLLLDDLPHVNRTLGMLHDLGVSLAIDDFGTGYSALQYLTRLDIDYVKIDKSFVQGAEADVQRQEVVRADRCARQCARHRSGRRGDRDIRPVRVLAWAGVRARTGLPVRPADGER